LHSPPGNAYEHRRDDYYSFFVTCFHLQDWIRNDRTVVLETREKVENFVATRRSLQACADIANGVKHLTLTNVRFDPLPRLAIGPHDLHAPLVACGMVGHTARSTPFDTMHNSADLVLLVNQVYARRVM